MNLSDHTDLIYVAFLLFGIAIVGNLYIANKIKRRMFIEFGLYSTLVWVTYTLLKKLVEYIYRFNLSSLISTTYNHESFYNQWKSDLVINTLSSILFYLPIFFLFSIVLFYLTRSASRFKIILSLLVISCGLFSCFFSMRFYQFDIWLELRIYRFIQHSSTLLLCIFLFKLQDKDLLVETSKFDDILDEPIYTQ